MDAGVEALRLIRDTMGEVPTAFGHALCALDLYVSRAKEVAIVGDPGSAATRALAAEVTTERFMPNHVLAVAETEDRRILRHRRRCSATGSRSRAARPRTCASASSASSRSPTPPHSPNSSSPNSTCLATRGNA